MSETLFAEALLGRDAQEFLESEIGRYLVGRADQEVAEAHEALSKVDVMDVARIRDLQNQVWRARSFKVWLVELYQSGQAAEATLDELDANDGQG